VTEEVVTEIGNFKSLLLCEDSTVFVESVCRGSVFL
jgi:hypothetical protein